MDERLKSWHPSPDELEQILREMRPIIVEFARRARNQAAPRSSARPTPAT
jgi:hypothetical protein